MDDDIDDAIEVWIEQLAERALVQSRAFNLREHGLDRPSYPYAFGVLKGLFAEELRGILARQAQVS